MSFLHFKWQLHSVRKWSVFAPYPSRLAPCRCHIFKPLSWHCRSVRARLPSASSPIRVLHSRTKKRKHTHTYMVCRYMYPLTSNRICCWFSPVAKLHSHLAAVSRRQTAKLNGAQCDKCGEKCFQEMWTIYTVYSIIYLFKLNTGINLEYVLLFFWKITKSIIIFNHRIISYQFLETVEGGRNNRVYFKTEKKTFINSELCHIHKSPNRNL